MAGFIVLENGTAYARSNWATDAALRVIARSVNDVQLREWLLAQQSLRVGSGVTSVDLRELSPAIRPVVAAAIRDAHSRLLVDGRFEGLVADDGIGADWFASFAALVLMLDRSEAGDVTGEFNPHMDALLPPTGGKAGPGWT